MLRAILRNMAGRSRLFLRGCDETAEEKPADLVRSELELLAQNKEKLLAAINAGSFGHRQLFRTPYGNKPLVYADYTASGRSLTFIEEYIAKEVLPCYSNTHTSTTWVAQQTTFFRQEARQIIHRNVGGCEDDVVIFCGSGSTAAINRLVRILQNCKWGTESQYIQKNRFGSYECKLCKMSFSSHGNYFNHLNSEVHRSQLPAASMPLQDLPTTPVVFVSCYEHHSNLLPWREAGAKVEVIPETPGGTLDMEYLEEKLQMYATHPYKIGSFSACSNISGIKTDPLALASTLHKHNALAFFDYASAAPYEEINMNTSEHAYMDAIFLSPHKFPGGPNTPGVLVVKKWLLGNKVPTAPGGGTVFFVTDQDHTYLLNHEEREEGGTPDIVGAIRAGLVFQLKEAVSAETIRNIEQKLQAKAMTRLLACPNVMVLGNPIAPRIPIISFVVRCGNRFLHYNFVSALLNDLFGVETRAGCACAGPYGQSALGISYELAKSFEEVLYQGQELYRPGFVRANLPYFASEEEVDYILDAIDFVANHGYWFLPQYKFDMDTGEFVHRTFETKEGRHNVRRWLGEITYSSGEMKYPEHNLPRAEDLGRYKQEAWDLLQSIREDAYCHYTLSDQTTAIPAQFEHLRWFVLPSEILSYLKRKTEEPFATPISPFYPPHVTSTPIPPVFPEESKEPAKKPKRWPK